MASKDSVNIKIGADFTGLSKQLETLKKKMKDGSVKSEDLEKALDDITQSEKELAKATAKTNEEFEAQRVGSKASIKSLADMRAAFELTKDAIKGVIRVAQELTAPFLEFDTGLAKIVSLAPETLKPLEKQIGDTVKRIAKDTGQDLAVVSEAIFQAQSSGKIDLTKGDVTFEALGEGAKFSTASFTNMNDAIDLTTASIAALKSKTTGDLGAENIEEIANVWTKTGQAGKTTVTEISKFFPATFKGAQDAGFAIEDIGASIVGLTSVLKTDLAATSFKAFTTSIQKNSKAMVDAGIKGVDEFTGKVTNQFDFFESIKAAKTELSAAEFAKLFGSQEAVTAAKILADNFQQSFTDNFTPEQLAGTVQESFDVMTDTAQFSVDQMKQEFNVLLVEIGEQIAPIFGQILPKVREIIDTITTEIDFEKVIGNVVSLVMTAIETLMPVVKFAIEVVSFFANGISEVSEKIGPLLPLLGGVAIAIKLITIALAANPFTLWLVGITLAIGALGAILGSLTQSWSDYAEGQLKAAEKIRDSRLEIDEETESLEKNKVAIDEVNDSLNALGADAEKPDVLAELEQTITDLEGIDEGASLGIQSIFNALETGHITATQAVDRSREVIANLKAETQEFIDRNTENSAILLEAEAATAADALGAAQTELIAKFNELKRQKDDPSREIDKSLLEDIRKLQDLEVTLKKQISETIKIDPKVADVAIAELQKKLNSIKMDESAAKQTAAMFGDGTVLQAVQDQFNEQEASIERQIEKLEQSKAIQIQKAEQAEINANLQRNITEALTDGKDVLSIIEEIEKGILDANESITEAQREQLELDKKQLQAKMLLIDAEIELNNQLLIGLAAENEKLTGFAKTTGLTKQAVATGDLEGAQEAKTRTQSSLDKINALLAKPTKKLTKDKDKDEKKEAKKQAKTAKKARDDEAKEVEKGRKAEAKKQADFRKKQLKVAEDAANALIDNEMKRLDEEMKIREDFTQTQLQIYDKIKSRVKKDQSQMKTQLEENDRFFDDLFDKAVTPQQEDEILEEREEHRTKILQEGLQNVANSIQDTRKSISEAFKKDDPISKWLRDITMNLEAEIKKAKKSTESITESFGLSSKGAAAAEQLKEERRVNEGNKARLVEFKEVGAQRGKDLAEGQEVKEGEFNSGIQAGFQDFVIRGLLGMLEENKELFGKNNAKLNKFIDDMFSSLLSVESREQLKLDNPKLFQDLENAIAAGNAEESQKAADAITAELLKSVNTSEKIAAAYIKSVKEFKFTQDEINKIISETIGFMKVNAEEQLKKLPSDASSERVASSAETAKANVGKNILDSFEQTSAAYIKAFGSSFSAEELVRAETQRINAEAKKIFEETGKIIPIESESSITLRLIKKYYESFTLTDAEIRVLESNLENESSESGKKIKKVLKSVSDEIATASSDIIVQDLVQLENKKLLAEANKKAVQELAKITRIEKAEALNALAAAEGRISTLNSLLIAQQTELNEFDEVSAQRIEAFSKAFGVDDPKVKKLIDDRDELRDLILKRQKAQLDEQIENLKGFTTDFKEIGRRQKAAQTLVTDAMEEFTAQIEIIKDKITVLAEEIAATNAKILLKQKQLTDSIEKERIELEKASSDEQKKRIKEKFKIEQDAFKEEIDSLQLNKKLKADELKKSDAELNRLEADKVKTEAELIAEQRKIKLQSAVNIGMGAIEKIGVLFDTFLSAFDEITNTITDPNLRTGEKIGKIAQTAGTAIDKVGDTIGDNIVGDAVKAVGLQFKIIGGIISGITTLMGDEAERSKLIVLDAAKSQLEEIKLGRLELQNEMKIANQLNSDLLFTARQQLELSRQSLEETLENATVNIHGADVDLGSLSKEELADLGTRFGTAEASTENTISNLERDLEIEENKRGKGKVKRKKELEAEIQAEKDRLELIKLQKGIVDEYISGQASLIGLQRRQAGEDLEDIQKKSTITELQAKIDGKSKEEISAIRLKAIRDEMEELKSQLIETDAFGELLFNENEREDINIKILELQLQEEESLNKQNELLKEMNGSEAQSLKFLKQRGSLRNQASQGINVASDLDAIDARLGVKGQFHNGGNVLDDGLYRLRKGEEVSTPEQLRAGDTNNNSSSVNTSDNRQYNVNVASGNGRFENQFNKFLRDKGFFQGLDQFVDKFKKI